MDDDFDALEKELKQLQPATPNEALLQKIEAELNRRPRRLAPLIWIGLTVPLAAAIALLVSFPRHAPLHVMPETSTKPAAVVTPKSPPTSEDLLKPVAAENILYAADDEGTVTLDGGARARRERLKYVDTIKWENPKTHASLTWSIPREEVRVVPVRYE